MSAADYADMAALVLGFAVVAYLAFWRGRQVGAAAGTRRARDADAARRVAVAAHAAEARAHDRTRRAWADERAGATPLHGPTATPIFDDVAVARLRRELDEWGTA